MQIAFKILKIIEITKFWYFFIKLTPILMQIAFKILKIPPILVFWLQQAIHKRASTPTYPSTHPLTLDSTFSLLIISVYALFKWKLTQPWLFILAYKGYSQSHRITIDCQINQRLYYMSSLCTSAYPKIQTMDPWGPRKFGFSRVDANNELTCHWQKGFVIRIIFSKLVVG